MAGPMPHLMFPGGYCFASPFNMMFHVFYTRQAYVRTIVKDTIYHTDLQNHPSQQFADEFHLAELTDLLFVYSLVVHPRTYCCFSNKPLL
jgi:hypothetical protein